MKINKILITGISGSGGSYLAEFINENFSQIKIHGISRWHSTTDHQNLYSIIKNVNIHEVDLNDLGSTLNVIKTLKPNPKFLS